MFVADGIFSSITVVISLWGWRVSMLASNVNIVLSPSLLNLLLISKQRSIIKDILTAGKMRPKPLRTTPDGLSERRTEIIDT